MNNEDFVTYEQALALKKLGFREPCLHYYEEGDTKKLHENFNNNEYKDIHISDLYYSFNSRNVSIIIDAPTLAQAQKWLRKNKHIHVEPNIVNENTFRYSIKSIPYSLCRSTRDIFNSYEEALSTGITECLKLLNEIC